MMLEIYFFKLFLARCYDAAGKDTCEWRVKNGHDCKAYYMKIDCAATCGYCGIDKLENQ